MNLRDVVAVEVDRRRGKAGIVDFGCRGVIGLEQLAVWDKYQGNVSRFAGYYPRITATPLTSGVSLTPMATSVLLKLGSHVFPA